jgi:hypothetical protein
VDLAEVSRLVRPRLFERRQAVLPLPGASLRAHLGLERPANRYAAARTAGEETR